MEAERLIDDVRQHPRIHLKNKPDRQKTAIENIKAILTERGKQLRHKDGDHVILDLCRESQEHIHSFR